MGKNFSGKNGISIKIITEKIKNEIEKGDSIKEKDRVIKKPHKLGNLTISDRKHISMGIDALSKIVHEGFDSDIKDFMIGDNDVSKLRREIIGYCSVIEDCIERLSIWASDEVHIQTKIENLQNYMEIAQATRDGLIIKQEKRTEIVNGEKKEVIYDTSMTIREVTSILMEYEGSAYRRQSRKLDNYMGIGLGIAAMIGLGVKKDKQENTKADKKIPIITMSTIARSGAYVLLDVVRKNDRQKFMDARSKMLNMRRDLINDEHISSKAISDEIENVKEAARIEEKLCNNYENKRFAPNLIMDLSIALLYGAYIHKNVKIKENGKIDGKSLARAIATLNANTSFVNGFSRSIQGIVESKKEDEEFKELCIKVKDILQQMEEKVYPLEGVKHSFDSISINNFTGKFYPKKNYETGETRYDLTLNVPEFSIKRGDVVLLSGDSGVGKSTFLRFLKRGDINNRNVIKIDDSEYVDNLGDEYISFKPSIDLGNENNVLYQLTGKNNISDLTESEKNNILSILKQMKFDNPNLLEELASKKFMEFSSGQQKRLALSKVFYRIDDGTSVVIVDEPVGNVEDSLIKEQLQMIKRYAERKNVILIITTHRLDIAEELATKRYNINKDGTVEQMPINKKEIDER